MQLSQCHLVLLQSNCFATLMLFSTVIHNALPPSGYFATCHASLPLMLMFCHSHTALLVRLPASHTLLLYYHAGCHCHPTMRLSYFLATLRLLPAVILLCQSCRMPASCVLLCHYHASCHCHATVLLSSDLQSSLILLCRSHASFLWSYTALTLSCYCCHCQAATPLMLPLCQCHTALLVALSAGLILLCHSHAAHHCHAT